jgi:hypothetical protein
MDEAEKEQLLNEIFRQKQERRLQLARLPIEEKFRILQQLQERARIVRASRLLNKDLP